MTQAADTANVFNPTLHNFVLLPDYKPPGGVRFYEHRNHACVNGAHDFHRLNLFLTQDGSFVTIWFGALDDILVGVVSRTQVEASGLR